VQCDHECVARLGIGRAWAVRSHFVMAANRRIGYRYLVVDDDMYAITFRYGGSYQIPTTVTVTPKAIVDDTSIVASKRSTEMLASLAKRSEATGVTKKRKRVILHKYHGRFGPKFTAMTSTSKKCQVFMLDNPLANYQTQNMVWQYLHFLRKNFDRDSGLFSIPLAGVLDPRPTAEGISTLP
jgi:hypothetical protein